ncbi:MAG: hypothetical protein Q9174_004980 [Haloplaca sp. 1 TL-2023]
MDQYFLDGFHDILQATVNECSGDKLQYLCEAFWDHLDTCTTPPQELLDAFVAVLQNEQYFAVARLVIPEFRALPATEPGNASKQHVMEHIASLQVKQIEMENGTTALFDDALYRAEKDTFTDAEMYRAGLLIYGRGNLDEVEKDEVQRWWAGRPGCLKQTSNAVEEGQES